MTLLEQTRVSQVESYLLPVTKVLKKEAGKLLLLSYALFAEVSKHSRQNFLMTQSEKEMLSFS